MKTLRALFTKYKYLCFVLAFSLFAVFDLHNYGIPPTHDGEYNVMRAAQFYKVLSEGILWPRWAPDFNNGFGIPIFSYIYPLPAYVSAFLHFLGVGFIDGFKLEMALATILGAIFFYLWAKKYWGMLGGLVSSVFYTFSPHHFVDIYVRGSAGEVLSLGIFPGLLWSYDAFRETREYKFFVLSCLFLCFLVLAHNILALMFFIFFLFYAVFVIVGSKNKKWEIEKLALLIFIALGLSAPFWLPALLETSFVQGLRIYDLTQSFPEIYQLIIPSWGYGLSPNDLANPMSVQIGLANLLAILMSLVFFFYLKNKGLILFFIISFLIVLFLITPYSIWVWKNLPLFSYFQFPWRLLSLEVLIVAFLAGSVASTNKLLAGLLIIIAFSSTFFYAKAATYYPRNDKYYLSRSNFIDGTNSPGDVFNTAWLPKIPKKTKNKIQIISGAGSVNLIKIRSTRYLFYSFLKKDSRIRVNTAYFPGWGIWVDGQVGSIQNDHGLIAVSLPAGKHLVSLSFGSTILQKLSYLYFLSSILLLVLLAQKADIIKR